MKPSATSPRLERLIYELLDAHDDTARLAQDIEEIHWVAHVEYLRRLQRLGRETLASIAVTSAAAPLAPAQDSASRRRSD